jgi:biopolymer transport protein ExbB
MYGLLLQIDTTAVDITPADLSLFELIMKGGVVMIPIAFLSVCVVYITVERYLYLKSVLKHPSNFVDTISGHLKEGNINAARSYASHFTSSTGFVMRSGIDSIGKPIRDIESVLESATNIEVAEMEKNLGYLGIIAGIAPMLGFVGTIVGIIHIFYDISLSDNISIGIIAGGLYEKMITSGAGLVVGILAYTAYHILYQRIHKFTRQIQKDCFEFLRSIQSRTA